MLLKRLYSKALLFALCGSMLVVSAGCGSTNSSVSETISSSGTEENVNEEGAEEGADGADSSSQESATAEIFAMDTYMTVTAYGSAAEEAVAAAEEEINRLDALLSTGIETSEIAMLNNSGGETVTLSEDTAVLVEEALALYEHTNGAFNIAVYPLMEAWGFTTQEFRVPEASEIAELLAYTDASKIEYNSETKEITLPEGVQIDLGGIAKGYTSAKVATIMKEYGISSAMINLGGNVQVLGSKTDGSDWRVAVQDPEDSDAMLGVLSVSDKAIITSGGYERYFEEDGITYHHILDPETGYPADNGVSSVTIISENGMLADGLSTSLFIMGEEKAAEYWQSHTDEFDYILVTEDGIMYVSEGIADSYETDGTVVLVEKE